MRYYQYHIGDFNNATRYASRLERSIYRDLLDMYYEDESAIDATDMNRLERRLNVRSTEEQEALKFVLTEYFENQNDFYFSNRCEAEIKKYQDKLEVAIKAGKASAEARRKKANKKKREGVDIIDVKDNSNGRSTDVQRTFNDCSTDVQPTSNHKPLTTNQEPLTNLKDNVIEKALNVSFDDFWNLYDKKKDRGKCELKWGRMTDEQRELTMQHLPAYVESTPDKTFRKDPATYLNNKSWENEIISNNKGINHVSHNPISSAVNSSGQQLSPVQAEIQRLKAERDNESGNGIRTVS